MAKRLSKSKYIAGLQCNKRLWLEIHSRDLATPPPPGMQRIFDQGTAVGEMATEEFPDGVLIEADYLNIPEAIKQTKEALNNSVDIIFEGCFVHGNVLVRPDIILRNDLGSWNMIEVKSSTGVKPENIHDVAVQTWVLQGCGLDMERVFLKHINRDCVYPNLSNLFKTVDITDQVKEVISTIPNNLSEFQSILGKPEPDVSIGEHCTNPYSCQFAEYCWKDIPEHSIFTIPRLRWTVKERLVAENKISIDALPGDFSLNDNQLDYLKSYEIKKPIIDWNSIEGELEKLKYPLHFLDFETDGQAVPRFDGIHPYEQFPFQYSCHIMDENGSLEHFEYLHESDTDPRQLLAESLTKSIGDTGSVVAYNAGFEKGVMHKLALWCPEYAEPLQSIIDRLWDQLDIFRNYYMDHRFKGSNSLKNVLPIMIPSMSYENLAVSDGTEAQVAWNEMIQLSNGDEKNKLINELKEYCGQDTLAMVEIHRTFQIGL